MGGGMVWCTHVLVCLLSFIFLSFVHCCVIYAYIHRIYTCIYMYVHVPWKLMREMRISITMKVPVRPMPAEQ